MPTIFTRAGQVFGILVVLCLSTLAAMAGDKTPYVIGAIFDVTGSGAPLGTPERDTALMLVKQINAKGGINGHPIKLVVYDNGSEEAQSVMTAKKLIESDKALAIIGPSQTGTTLAIANTVEASSTPLVSCAAGVKIVQPVKPWIFKTAQSDVSAVAKVLDYLKAHKISKVAIITVSNAFGDSGKAQLLAQAPGVKVQIVAQESFVDKDTDMSAQLMKIRGKTPQAIICWGTNPGPAVVAKNMQTLGMKMPLIMSHGVANRKFIDLAGPAANGVVFPAGRLLVVSEIPKNDKQKSVLQSYEADFTKEYNRTADTFGGHAYDALMLVCQALKKVGPDKAKIRAELERTKGFVGISGVFQFSKDDHNGLGKDAFVMVKVVNGKWTLDK